MKKLFLKLLTVVLVIANLLNIYIYIFQLPKINSTPLDDYKVEEYDYAGSKHPVYHQFWQKAIFDMCTGLNYVDLVRLEGKTYFLTEKYVETCFKDIIGLEQVFGINTYWIDSFKYDLGNGNYSEGEYNRVGYDSSGKMIWLRLDPDQDLPKLESPREETEELAKEYFKKYMSKNLRAETDENSEYRMYYVRKGHINSSADDPEMLKVYEGYNDSEYDELNILDYPDMTSVDYYKYTFVKFVKGKATDEYVDIYVYENGELYIINTGFSYPILSEDVIEYDEAKLNERVKAEARKYYEVDNADYYKDDKIADIRVSKNLPYKDSLGRRGIHSCVVVEFEDGRKKTNSVYILLEDVTFSVRYPLVTFVIIEAVIFAGTVVWIIWRIRTKKKSKG